MLPIAVDTFCEALEKRKTKLPYTANTLFDEGFAHSFLAFCATSGSGTEALAMFAALRAWFNAIPRARHVQRDCVVNGSRRPQPETYHAAMRAIIGARLASHPTLQVDGRSGAIAACILACRGHTAGR